VLGFGEIKSVPFSKGVSFFQSLAGDCLLIFIGRDRAFQCELKGDLPADF
jgi:hypothetical protein